MRLSCEARIHNGLVFRVERPVIFCPASIQTGVEGAVLIS